MASRSARPITYLAPRKSVNPRSARALAPSRRSAALRQVLLSENSAASLSASPVNEYCRPALKPATTGET